MKNTCFAPSFYRGLPPVALLAAFLVIVAGCMEETEPPSDFVSTEYVADGREIYETHCASCHGVDANGNGSVASLLTIPPPDLTRIQLRNDGIFPVDSLFSMIDGREEVPAHGTREMPIWGNAWSSIDGIPQSEEVVSQRINLLIEYLRSIQIESEP